MITWVDMDDPKWKVDFVKYSGKIDNTRNEVSEARFRDYGFLKYWFRGVEKFAPWVRKIHFVTCGQKPAWLDANHPKLALVSHSDYIPNEFLPVFNSSLIEIYLHKIPNLADHFVYFNDDSFITNHTEKDRFFTDGLPNDIAAFRHNFGTGLWTKCLKNNIKIISQKFDKREVLKRDHDKWFHPSYGKKSRLTRLLKPYGEFITLVTPHNAQPYLKSTFEEVWNYAGDKFTAVSINRFRSPNEYTQELFRTWQICRSNFNPYNTYKNTKMFPLILQSNEAIKSIYDQTYKLICLNDNAHIRNYTQVMQEIEKAFETILPEKSEFEI
ncbi:hypothetical protein [Proteiniphilum sp.]|uniref:hypothetical protein n=1 Tax=Proteiniphilum sp. TaxID=1926877 RepID=UPI002B1F8BD0|nr:hypothetical protein [Proteiniphilum sp.]MEA4916897.1 hypothetical protein [Proteiniphilum sp.]